MKQAKIENINQKNITSYNPVTSIIKSDKYIRLCMNMMTLNGTIERITGNNRHRRDT